MELTPIRIPGKRRRKGAPPIVFDVGSAASRRHRKDSGSNSSKRRGRSRESTSSDMKKKKRQKVAKRPKASYLERELPLEIVERIFWMSENINFARSGPRVGQLLSSPSTRRETFLQAFGPTWDVWFGVVRTNHLRVASYHDWQQDVARFGGNPEFQSALLQYSWVDISFILSCVDSWAQKYARDRFYQHQKLWGDPPSTFDADSQDQLPEEDEADAGGIGSFTSASRYFEHDYAAFAAQAERGDPLPALDDEWSWIEVHRETQIPDGLLTGPSWDDAAMRKLFWLVRAGARLSSDQTWETTLEGYHNAMKSTGDDHVNLLVIRLLLTLAGDHWPAHIASAELDKLHDKERELWSSQQREVYSRYACVARMLVQRYSAPTADT
ncbi:hypothetical protein PFICI_10547 [Pestalotiopsis fici W106-1]|uniref:Uncharacterized protein n=1 Tax=Pestalotiopsis fici (strain W106-1 / CGMCC3.15140) TaxID=1229662 RepID=W3WXA6_PESFW|nr:uncharacterized protein PFICI_10547 [Pestalotiopsis fici W106-1]ETS78485.1 hypothetical protein PFICI_10547 [Pestalotiopsis fici W106-1]